ncbi:helix-turn-helix domain-containing protein [Lichenibacterium ramalinae]|uniref:XRE family transcriptional regulator n=1 Tax=Lichenibacterium ramalinae TaxID=2316527 RepID=A0A4Q2R792_9HYPH|nr:helix-turn-helix transcriptional regulator [Lichenibacterium ramalinae]RYB02471.1 XRE family transcriptional regulator [Lichenibacterium ramalinae]
MDGRARLAWNVRHLRALRGLSQEALEVDAGVAAPYLSGIERRVVNPTVDVLDRLAGALGVEVDVLLRAYDSHSTPPQPLKAGRKPRQPVRRDVG